MNNNAKPGLIILAAAIMGLIVAAIEQISYDNQYFLNQYVTQASQLPGLQVMTIVLFLLIGCALAAISQ